MTDGFAIAAIITAVGAIISPVIMFILQRESNKVQVDKIEEVKVLMNGISEQRDLATAKSARAEGMLEGQAEQRARPLVSAAAPLPVPLTAEQQEATLQEQLKVVQAQLDALRTLPKK